MVVNTRVLIVDDEKHMCNLLSKLLKRMGYNVVGAANSGAQAIEMVKQLFPDIILMDILMEGRIDGIEAALKIQTITDVPLIFSTAEKDAGVISQALGTNPFGYINKPYRAEDLKAQIEVSLIRFKYEKELRETQAALEKSETLFRGIFNNIQSGYFQIDKNYCLTLVNPSMADILGVKVQDSLLGKNLFECFFADKKAASEFRQTLEKSDEIQISDAKWIDDNGTVKHILFNIQKSSGNPDTSDGFTGTVQDFTSYKNLETQLRHAQKMEVIGTLSSRIAHEINNQLTTVLGYADLCQMLINKDNRQYQYISSIRKKAGEAMETTRHLLKFGRKQIAVLKSFIVDELIEEKSELISHVVGKGISIETDLNTYDVNIYADPKLLEQVIMNLIINARDSMGKTGKLVIKTEQILDNKETNWSAKLPDKKYLMLSIIDDGPGIPPDKIEEIFEPFYTTKSESIGTGLGLTVVNSIIKEIKGFIHVESIPEKETCFRLLLPLTDQQHK